MNQVACQYAIIRFLPYAETGEFANVGVVLACPATGYIDARLMPLQKTGRIAGFFEQLDKRIYREAMAYLREELSRIRDLARERADMGNTGVVQQTFAGLTRPQEALLRFSDTRVILAEEPEDTLSKLFARFVERDFAGREYHDQVLERGVRKMLRRANLGDYFKPADIGNHDVHIHMPFVFQRDGRPQIAIKPLDLAKDEPNKVFDVGGHWVDRMRRLGKRHLLPAEMLFAVELPAPTAKGTHNAADEILGELREEGIKVLTVTDAAAITAFAAEAARH